MYFAAIGDSFTEGVGDPVGPERYGPMRGWADLVATGLAAALDEPVFYANFAIRGKLIDEIVAEQLEVALALSPKPTLLAFNGGGNDMMRPGFKLDSIMGLIDHAMERCEAQGVELLLLSGGDPTARLPRGRLMSERGDIYLDAVNAMLADRPQQRYVNNWIDPVLATAPFWDGDRLHLNALGHSRVAARVLTELGVPTPLPEAEDLPATASGPWVEAKYYATYVLPWLARRLTGRSSGDGRSPKHPDWVEVPAP